MLGPVELVRLERSLQAAHAPIVRHFRDGASDSALTAASEELGCVLPTEIRTWFAWHDGTADAESPIEGYLGPFWPHRLSEAAGGVREYRRIALDAAQGDVRTADELWKESWMPLGPVGGADVAVDIRGAADGPVPVYLVHWQEPSVAAAPKCDSLKQLVDLWSEALRSGIWTWDERKRSWEFGDFEALGPEFSEVLGRV